MFIVELEKGVFLAPWKGDPGRTLKYRNAMKYGTKHAAKIALGLARKYRPFKDAVIH